MHTNHSLPSLPLRHPLPVKTKQACKARDRNKSSRPRLLQGARQGYARYDSPEDVEEVLAVLEDNPEAFVVRGEPGTVVAVTGQDELDYMRRVSPLGG